MKFIFFLLHKTFYNKSLILTSVFFFFFISCSSKQSLIKPQETSKAYEKYRLYGNFIKGRLYEIGGNKEKALQYYKHIVKRDSEAFYLNYLIANILYENNDYSKASKYLKKLISKDTTLDYFELYGKVLYKIKEYKNAENIYEYISNKYPNNYRFNQILAVLYENNGKIKKAIEKYLDLAEKKYNKKGFIEKAVFLLIKNKNYIKAFEETKEFLMEHPNAKQMRLNLMLLYDNIKDKDLICKAYKDLMKKYPDNQNLKMDYASLMIKNDNFEKAEEIYKIILENDSDYKYKKTYAFILLSNKKHQMAKSILLDLKKINPEDEDIPFYLGIIYLNEKDHAKAINCFDEAISINPKFANAYKNKGLIYMRDNEYKKALNEFNNLTDIKSDNPENFYLKGLIYNEFKKYHNALKCFKKAYMLDKDNIDYAFNMAAAYERAGKTDSAMYYFKTIIKKDPSNHQALNYLGYMYADMGIKLNIAKKYIKKALEFEPDNGAYLDSYGWVLYKLKNINKAEKLIKKALEIRKDDPVILEHMAIIKESLDNHEKAKDYWQKILTIKPDHEKAKKALEKTKYKTTD